MSAALALSILDFQHPGKSVALACAADEWGFSRYWLGEHHDAAGQCANPLLLGALLAGTTSRIRVGTGGVSLTYHSALQVAEDARLIEYMLPDRFDLGVTRGLLPDGPVSRALLEGRDSGSGAAYAEKIRMLHGLVTGRIDPGHPLAAMRSYLDGGPPLWLLGLSPASAQLAGQLGLGFCFSVHHGSREIDGPGVMRHYLDSFIPSPEFPEPATIVVVRCICAATEAEARSLEAGFIGAPLLNETVLGTPGRCADRIAEIARELSTTEIMLIDFIEKSWDARLEMYRLLGQELGLPVAQPGPSPDWVPA